MPKFPSISAFKAIKCFEKIGYEVVRQKGSHIRLHHVHKKPLTIPRHKTLGTGLLRKLLRDAELTIEQFSDLL
jgi:predicted RNA binding protein YcfA (HicA-like mRNA interferase family)